MRLARGGFAVAALGLACLGGCAAPDPGRTGGFDARFERRIEPVGLAIWTVDRDGLVTYAGGRDAVLGRTSWSGPLDDEQVDRFVDLAAVLLGNEMAAEGDRDAADAGVRTRVELRGPDGRRRFDLAGEPAAFAELRVFLEQVSRARLDPVLDRLPRATPEPVEAEEAPGG